jgi:energy-coupling factor transport system permease protein
MAAQVAHYAPGDTFLHRLHPLAKLLAAVLTCVAAFLFPSWIVPAALAVFLAVLHAPAAIGFKRLGAVLKPLPLFVAIIVLANMFLVRRGGSPWENAGAGLVQSLRVVVSIVAANLFFAVTDAVELADSVLRILSPLRRIGLRVGELSLMTMVTFSFIPLMADEARRLQLAQAVRRGFPRSVPGAIRGTAYLVTPLVIGLFRRADELDLALQARCYRMDAPRSSLSHRGLGTVDCLVCAGFVFLFCVGLYVQF